MLHSKSLQNENSLCDVQYAFFCFQPVFEIILIMFIFIIVVSSVEVLHFLLDEK